MEQKSLRSSNFRRLAVRPVAVVLWLGLGAVLFIAGRGHTLLLDNKDFDAAAAPDLITIYVDRGRGVEYFRGDRDRVLVTGSKHRIRIEFSDGSPDFEGDFFLPLMGDMYLLSVPKMLSGIEPFVEVFHISAAPESGDEASGGDRSDEFSAEMDDLEQR